MMYANRKGIARIWVDRSLFRASFDTMMRSCPYKITGVSSATRALIPSAILPRISIQITIARIKG